MLPVYVFIYGGNFTNGSNDLLVYDGSNLAKKGVIVVGINYRVNALGFFGNESTAKNIIDEKGASHTTNGNWGILDQIFALK
jgi:para-nitrobenzyl esterase